MKKTIILLGVILTAFVFEADAQQLARRTQYMFNTYLTNPAVAGTKTYSPIAASFRSQWAGFDGGPQTYMVSGHTNLPNNRVGIGGIVFHDDAGGAISRTGAELTGAYHVDLNNRDAVSFGLSAVVTQFGFDGEGLEVLDENDQALIGANESTFNFDATFGMMVYGPNYFFGFSIPQLIQTELGIEGVIAEDNENVRHFNFMGSYLYYANEDFAIQPSALVRFTGSSPVQFDILAKAIYQEFIWAGLSYRHQDAVALAVGIDYEQFGVGYSYDITTSNAASFSPHTHEVTVAYNIPRSGKFQRRTVRRRGFR